MTIVTEFGKLRYNRLYMGMCDLGDPLQSKVEQLLGDVEDVKTYIGDILVLTKESLSKHIKELRIIFSILRAASLKVNAPKRSFGLKEVTYLGYIITREGIKTDKKKVKGIMDIGRLTTTTKARALIGMFQYYRDMWPM